MAPLLLSACIPQAVNYSAPTATAIDPKTRRIDYWLDQPASVSVSSSNFDALWAAASQTAVEHSFALDLSDPREGVLTTWPLISKMPFELWKRDVADGNSQLECTVSTMRRTIHFIVRKTGDAQFVCEPKVVVEHYAMPERRITSVIEYQEAFSVHRPAINGADDEGEALPVDYWYAIRRDSALERDLADSMRKILGEKPKAIAQAHSNVPNG